MSLLVVFTVLSSMNAVIITGSRTNYAFGRDFPLFSFLGRWNGGANTPVNALVFQSAIALALVLLGTGTRSGFATMVEYTAPVFWLFFLLVGISLFVLRRKERAIARPFRVPLYPATPLVFCGACLYMLYSSLVYTGKGGLIGRHRAARGHPPLPSQEAAAPPRKAVVGACRPFRRRLSALSAAVLQARRDLPLDLRVGLLLYLPELRELVGQDKGKGVAAFSHARRPSYPVDVVLVVLGHVVVDDRLYVVHVDAPAATSVATRMRSSFLRNLDIAWSRRDWVMSPCRLSTR